MAKLRLTAKKINIRKLLYNISIASAIALFTFLFIFFLVTSTLTPNPLKSYINTQFNSLKLSVFVIAIFILSLVSSYRGNEIRENLTILEESFEELYYKKIPHIIMGIGYSLMLALFLIVLNFGFKSTGNVMTLPPYEFTVGFLMGLSIFIIAFGVLFFILGLYAKRSLKLKVRSTSQSEWMQRNKDIFFPILQVIVSIITVVLAYLKYLKT